MCGIAGILTGKRDRAEAQEAALRMTQALAHRGPDDSGVESIDLPGGLHLCLGHRRLAILDLSPLAHQPMHDDGTNSWVVFNGEIYNHLALRRRLPAVEFRSKSDTETLLRGWVEFGSAWVEQLRGIFAFALYDGRRGELWLARDHLGVKPLYVANPRPDLWLFASEVRSLLASGLVDRRMSREGLSSYLAFGAVQAPWTMVEGVRSLLPAEQLRFSLPATGELTSPQASRYWLPAFPSSAARDTARNGSSTRRSTVDRESLDRLRSVWDEAVTGQRLSDVPLGVFLSGGIDSSAIVATLARLGHRPTTFSVAFAEGDYDESRHARAVAAACGSEHRELAVGPDEVLQHFDRALASYDQPSIDGVNTYVISKAVRDAGMTVALSGLGGDEVFAGYASFRRLPRLERWLRWPSPRVRKLLGRAAARVIRSEGRRTRLVQLLESSQSRLDVYCVLRQLYSPDSVARLLGGGATRRAGLAADLADDLRRRSAAIDSINAVSLLEQSLYMHNMLLRDADQMSMAHALEVRVPLLDHVLVDEVARLPGPFKLAGRGVANKWLLVELAGPLLPREVVHRPKRGFVFPWQRWLRRELRPRVEEVLLQPSITRAAGLDPASVDSIWQNFLAGKGGLRYSDVLALVHLAHWTAAQRLSAPADIEAPCAA